MPIKWQKARVLRDAGTSDRFVGRELWVDAATIKETPNIDLNSGFSKRPRRKVKSNVEVVGGPLGDGFLWPPLEAIELLPEFAADIPAIPFDEWIAQSQKEHDDQCR